MGFAIVYQRPEERFAYLRLGEAHLMLEEAAGPGRRFHDAAIGPPYGHGVNFQIRVPDAAALHDRLVAAAVTLRLPLEERWYRKDAEEIGLSQFVIADPDGYLLRFAAELGRRPRDAPATER